MQHTGRAPGGGGNSGGDGAVATTAHNSGGGVVFTESRIRGRQNRNKLFGTNSKHRACHAWSNSMPRGFLGIFGANRSRATQRVCTFQLLWPLVEPLGGGEVANRINWLNFPTSMVELFFLPPFPKV